MKTHILSWIFLLFLTLNASAFDFRPDIIIPGVHTVGLYEFPESYAGESIGADTYRWRM